MKMKLWDRLALCFGALLTLTSAVLLFLQGLQENNSTILYVTLAVLLAVFGVYLALLFRRFYAKRNEFVIQRTENGELRIAVKAIENQVQKCIDLHEEIQVSTLNILTTREGVVVDLVVTLANNISIPLAVASLQKQIKQYLIASSGIEVKEVRVSVESTQNTALSDAPAVEAEQPAKAEQKAPMHQRLFGRPDEPAIVPEPPKEESADGEETAAEAEPGEAAAAEEAKDPSVSAWLKPAAETEESAEEPAADAAADAPKSIREPELVNTPPAEEAPEEKSEPLPESEVKPESEEKTNE